MRWIKVELIGRLEGAFVLFCNIEFEGDVEESSIWDVEELFVAVLEVLSEPFIDGLGLFKLKFVRLLKGASVFFCNVKVEGDVDAVLSVRAFDLNKAGVAFPARPDVNMIESLEMRVEA